MKNNYKVIDFFCGAGGFSEGFRQQGFDIVKGIDFWQPAIDSHNLNHQLDDSVKNILEFWGRNSLDVTEALGLPSAEIIVGSPSCVSFSMSNKAGKADKTDGINLIKAFLRVIAIQKHKPNSKLKAWYMENVPESRTHIKEKYTFQNLNLSKWAISIGKKPWNTAIIIKGETLNAGDYGAPQNRRRYIVGEWVETGEYLLPRITSAAHVTVADIRDKMPSPIEARQENNKKVWADPNYPHLTIDTPAITDHFYDTGLYKIEWEKAEHLKTNHPFMGKMSFPEDENRSCRTIMATRSASTREALIYKSEYNRIGNGEYRLPTIREIATLMGYPYCYQFVGTESQKWKQIGNSVSPHLSAALAKKIIEKAGLKPVEKPNFDKLINNHEKVTNLNSFSEKSFDNPKRRVLNARFRRHPLKSGNMTVDLLNYHPTKKSVIGKKWYVAAFAGTGEAHKVKILKNKDIADIEKLLEKNFPKFESFRNQLLGWENLSANPQSIYEEDLNLENVNNPINKVKEVNEIIQSFPEESLDILIQNHKLFPKDSVPISHLMATYALSKLT